MFALAAVQILLFVCVERRGLAVAHETQFFVQRRVAEGVYRSQRDFFLVQVLGDALPQL